MDRLGHGPVFRASIASEIKDDVKFLTNAAGVHGLLAFDHGKKTSDLVDDENNPSKKGKATHQTNYTPYIVGALIVAGVLYYTRS